MPCIVTPPARRQVREVLTVKIGLQIASVYAGLKGTNPALWYHPTTPMNESLQIESDAKHLTLKK
jgi:hypothetical protein